MNGFEKALPLALCAALMLACSSSNSGNTGGSSGSTTQADGGGTKDNSGGGSGAPQATCASGQTNVADQWYAVAECKDYFDTAERCTCASQADVASCEKTFTSTLASSFCYPQGVTFSADSAKSACSQALSAYKQANPSCT